VIEHSKGATVLTRVSQALQLPQYLLPSSPLSTDVMVNHDTLCAIKVSVYFF